MEVPEGTDKTHKEGEQEDYLLSDDSKEAVLLDENKNVWNDKDLENRSPLTIKNVCSMKTETEKSNADITDNKTPEPDDAFDLMDSQNSGESAEGEEIAPEKSELKKVSPDEKDESHENGKESETLGRNSVENDEISGKDDASSSGSSKPKESGAEETVEKTCFNCAEKHLWKQCPYNLDVDEMVRRRQAYEESIGTAPKRLFLPGLVSNSLRNAMGLRAFDLPKYIYNMRKVGYPPGWLKNAVEYRDDNGTTKPHLIKVKLPDYPGFTSPVPNGFKDDGSRFDAKFSPQNAIENIVKLWKSQTESSTELANKLRSALNEPTQPAKDKIPTEQRGAVPVVSISPYNIPREQSLNYRETQKMEEKLRREAQMSSKTNQDQGQNNAQSSVPVASTSSMCGTAAREIPVIVLDADDDDAGPSGNSLLPRKRKGEADLDDAIAPKRAKTRFHLPTDTNQRSLPSFAADLSHSDIEVADGLLMLASALTRGGGGKSGESKDPPKIPIIIDLASSDSDEDPENDSPPTDEATSKNDQSGARAESGNEKEEEIWDDSESSSSSQGDDDAEDEEKENLCGIGMTSPEFENLDGGDEEKEYLDLDTTGPASPGIKNVGEDVEEKE